MDWIKVVPFDARGDREPSLDSSMPGSFNPAYREPFESRPASHQHAWATRGGIIVTVSAGHEVREDDPPHGP